MALPIAAIIAGATTQAGSNIITNVVNRKNVQDTNEQRYKMFREQLDYNDASAQMQRQMAAGLHPMTMSGLQPTDAPTAPDYESFEARNPFSGAIDTGQSIAQQMIQEKQLGLSEKQIEVEGLKTTVDALNAITALMGENLTSDEAFQILNKFPALSSLSNSDSVVLHRDSTLVNSLKNQIESSNLDLKEKKYLYGWLDEFTNAEYDLLVSQKEKNITSSQLDKANISLSQIKEDTERSIQSLNEDERTHIQQLTSNLQEQWKSLNFQGELDIKKLERVSELSNSLVEDLISKAQLSKNEATYWVWSKLLENYHPIDAGKWRLGSPFNKAMSTAWNMGQPLPINKH